MVVITEATMAMRRKNKEEAVMKNKNLVHYLVLVEGVVLAVMIVLVLMQQLAGRKEHKTQPDNEEQLFTTEEMDSTQQTEVLPKQTAYIEETVTFQPEVMQKLDAMSTGEKVAQMFLLTPEMLTATDQVTVAGAGSKTALDTYPVGGLLYTEHNFLGKEQTAKMLHGVQEYSQERIGVPLFLAAAEEGGNDYSPVAVSNDYGIAAAAADITSLEDAASAATAIGTYLHTEGFNLNLAPYAVAGDARSFQGDESAVNEMAAAQIDAFRQLGIFSVLMYYPAYAAELEQDADCIMMGNVTASDLTEGEDILCTMSAQTISTLRSDRGYSGIIISGSLSDETITGKYDAASAAIAAVQAGNDMLYLPADFPMAYQAVVDAVNDGTIAMDRINCSVGRILTGKLKLTQIQEEIPSDGENTSEDGV